jgi:hypothetical protein
MKRPDLESVTPGLGGSRICPDPQQQQQQNENEKKKFHRFLYNK